MAYSTQTDLENRLGGAQRLAELCNDVDGKINADTSIVTMLISRADAIIDAYAGQVYDVPFTTVPSIVNNISVDLACYYALQRRFTEVKMPDDWTKVYKDAMGMLQGIADLSVRLDASTTVSSEEGKIVANDQIFDFSDDSEAEVSTF